MATGGVRLPYVDILKGIAIVLVVVGHVFGFFVPYHDGMGSVVHRVIYSFHMPLFMALAGYVARLVFCGSLWAEWLKKARTLMLPWVCMSTGYVLLQYGTEDSSLLLSMEARKGYWFLVTLFAIHCVVIIINVVMNWMTEVTIFRFGCVRYCHCFCTYGRKAHLTEQVSKAFLYGPDKVNIYY